jgi:superfamily II DNA/RNA helicase
VTDFLKGIRDSSLTTGKSIVLGDPGKLGNFEECQQYLSTIVQTMAAQSKSERHVSSVTTDGGEKGGSLVDKIKGGTYTDEQYRSLSEQEKKRIQKYREQAQKKKTNKRKVRREKCKLAKAKSDRNNASAEDDEATEPAKALGANSKAGAQFGSNGNKATETEDLTRAPQL